MFNGERKTIKKQLLSGVLTQEVVDKERKEIEKEMKTNIEDDTNQYKSQVKGKVLFGQVPMGVTKEHNCKSLASFIYVC